jgi:ectoine hydroxylase-related dioxygenase (phytanoyl-CoA dioxygenase family)
MKRTRLMTNSTPLLHDRNALLQKAEEDGYLYFKTLLPEEDVLAVREDLLRVVNSFGWLAPNQTVMAGHLDLSALSRVPEDEMRTDIGVSIAAYHEVQKLESFHRLPHHPNLIHLFETLFAKKVLPHPRHIARMVTAHPGMVPTPIHQDFPLIQGTSNTWTCWIPVGDCPRALGGLTVLRGSHKLGYLPVQPTQGAGNIEAQLCEWENDWVETDYQVGDVLIFPSYTVHKALKCQTPELIRLSLDVRYQPVDEVIEAKSLLPHCELTWEDIYASWQQEDLKYYWRKLSPKLSPWNDAYLQPARRIC